MNIQKKSEDFPLETGLLLGAHVSQDGGSTQLTALAERIDNSTCGKLSNLLKKFPLIKEIKSRLFYDLHSVYHLICLVDIGPKTTNINDLEECDEKKENIRKAVASGIIKLTEAGAVSVTLDPCDDEESVAEAANLVTFKYAQYHCHLTDKPDVSVKLFNGLTGLWHVGFLKADAQNFARSLMETPTSHLVPSQFIERISLKVKDLGILQTIRERDWIHQHGMSTFRRVCGWQAEAVLFEMHYNGAIEKKEIIIIGKGITYDSNLHEIRADMNDAAIVSAVIYAAASLKLKLNLKGIIPLPCCEDLVKPGDVVFAMNEKSIQAEGNGLEGILILAEALLYANSLKPNFILDLATLPGKNCAGLGTGATEVFSNDTALFNLLHEASRYTGDRIWRLPLFEHYADAMKSCQATDLKISEFESSCNAAAFLKQFVGDSRWIHMDVTHVIKQKEKGIPYLQKGMTGRPTRTLIEFLRIIQRKSVE